MNTIQTIKPAKVVQFLFFTCMIFLGLNSGAFAAGDLPGFGGQSGATEVNTFFTNVTTVLLYICAFVALIIIILAFKGLAGQGDWRTFWNKIAGGIGIFVVPALVRYLVTQGG
jgi:type IV secretory pathway VirB2 component (pilin)